MRHALKFLMPILALSATGAQAQSDGWRMSEVSGDVRVTEGGRTRAATRGLLLSSGAAVSAGAQSRAVLVRGRQYVVVSPNSQVRVAPPQGQQSRGIVQMITDWGSALFRIDRREAPHFGVRTPYLAAVVRGTTFTVTVSAARASVEVQEGAVEVSTLDGGASDLVRPGMIASVEASDRFQLSIAGEGARVIRSPEGGPPAATPPAPAQPQASSRSVISRPIGEEPVSFERATGGLVRGDSAIAHAMVEVAAAARDRGRPDDRGARDDRGAPDDRGRPDDRGNGGDGNNGNGGNGGKGGGNGGGGTPPPGGNGNDRDPGRPADSPADDRDEDERRGRGGPDEREDRRDDRDDRGRGGDDGDDDDGDRDEADDDGDRDEDDDDDRRD